MARISVPQPDGEVVITEAGTPTVYRIKDGVIDVDNTHVGAILAAIEGSELKPEAPVSNAKSEAPTKEK